MSRQFAGTADELDSDLLMVWHALSHWERMDGEWGQQVNFLKSDLRKRQEERRHREFKEGEEPKRKWVRTENFWRFTGSPFNIGFDPKEPSPWDVFCDEPTEGMARAWVVSFDSMEEARTFVEKRCEEMDKFEAGP